MVVNGVPWSSTWRRCCCAGVLVVEGGVVGVTWRLCRCLAYAVSEQGVVADGVLTWGRREEWEDGGLAMVVVGSKQATWERLAG